jgi:hypothetical protein
MRHVLPAADPAASLQEVVAMAIDFTLGPELEKI